MILRSKEEIIQEVKSLQEYLIKSLEEGKEVSVEKSQHITATATTLFVELGVESQCQRD